jgi:hypothetical protein
LIALVKITAVTTVFEGQKFVLSWILQIGLSFGGRGALKKYIRLHDLNMDVVICNFQRIVQKKNTCVECSGGHLNNLWAHCPPLTFGIALWFLHQESAIHRDSCFDCWLVWAWRSY